MGLGALRRHPYRYSAPPEASITQVEFESKFEEALNILLEKNEINLQTDSVEDIKQKVINSKYFME